MKQQGWEDRCPTGFLGCLETPRHTSGYPEHPHDADDGGVDGQGSVHLDLLQRDAHDGQQNDGQVQLVPPTDTGETHGIIQLSMDNPRGGFVSIFVFITGTEEFQGHLLILIWARDFRGNQTSSKQLAQTSREPQNLGSH